MSCQQEFISGADTVRALLSILRLPAVFTLYTLYSLGIYFYDARGNNVRRNINLLPRVTFFQRNSS